MGKKYKAKYSGRIYNTAREAALDNGKYLTDVEYRFNVKADNVSHPKSYEIPFIRSKRRTLTNAGLATGAVISENLLDTIAKYANLAGLPIKTALGLAVKESTLGNPTDDTSVYKILNKEKADYFKQQGTGSHINPGEAIQPENLFNFYKDETDPYTEAIRYSLDYITGSGDPEDYTRFTESLKRGEKYADSKVKEYEQKYGNNNTIYNALKFYKDHPDQYNPGQPNYQQLVDKRANEVWASPEIQAWYKRSLEGGGR